MKAIINPAIIQEVTASEERYKIDFNSIARELEDLFHHCASKLKSSGGTGSSEVKTLTNLTSTLLQLEFNSHKDKEMDLLKAELAEIQDAICNIGN